MSVVSRDWEYFYSLLDRTLVHHRVISSINSPVPLIQQGVERHLDLKRLAQEHKATSLARLELGPLNPETSSFTMRPI